MTKKKFQELEELCKKAWEELAVTGLGEKPDYLVGYINKCPACHISMLATDPDTPWHWYDDRDQECKLCPIDRWRKIAEETDIEVYGGAACQVKGEAYNDWVYKHTSKARKKAAAIIAGLKWTYLPVYQRIKNADLCVKDE